MIRPRSSLLYPLLCLLLALAAAAPAARADDDPDTEVAKRLFKQGSSLYAAGQYEKALKAFQDAKLAKNLPAFDFNIALCYDRLGRWAEALAAYERFAETSSKPDQVAEAKARIPVLRDRVKNSANRTIADEHYRKAIVHFNNNAYALAAEEFVLAHRAVPDSLYLYSAGQAYRLANDNASALRYYREFLKAAPDSPQRPAVEARVKELERTKPGARPPVVLKPSPPGAASAGSERGKEVAELIKSKRAGFRKCFDEWSAKHPGLGGQVDLSFFLDPDGMPQQVEVQLKNFDAPEVASCIMQYARTLAYPTAPNGKYTRFRYPFDFKP